MEIETDEEKQEEEKSVPTHQSNHRKNKRISERELTGNRKEQAPSRKISARLEMNDFLSTAGI